MTISLVFGYKTKLSNNVYETLSLQANAMGTFNILNGEDRMVAAALILPEKKDDDDEQ